ncbi:metal ABC transporter permease [Oerskovia sp. M15]
MCALLSCWLVLIGWSLLGDAVSHAVLPGSCSRTSSGAVRRRRAGVRDRRGRAHRRVRDTTRLKEDAAIGVVFTTLFAIGIVLISVTPSQIDLGHILFGNMLGITDTDLWQVVVLGALTAVVLVLKRRDLTLFAFDPVHAHAVGISPRRLSALLLGSLALTVVVALQAVGVVLVVALVITPGATAYLLVDRMSRMLVVAPLLAVGCAVVGIYASYYLDTASAATIVVAQGIVFAVAYVVHVARRRESGASRPDGGARARRDAGRVRCAGARTASLEGVRPPESRGAQRAVK